MESTPRKASLGRDAEREDPTSEFGAIVRKDVAGPKPGKRKLLPKTILEPQTIPVVGTEKGEE